MVHAQHCYGWKRATTRKLTKVFQLTPEESVVPPTLVDHRAQMPAVYNQGQLGSCVDNAVAAEIEACMLAQGFPDFTPSRLYNYYNARAIEGTTHTDSGSTCHDGIMAGVTHGYVEETKWPYDITKFKVKPPVELYAEGKTDLITDYGSVTQDLATIRAIVAAGHNVIIGFDVYESFESAAVAASGIMPVPDTTTEQLLGGHCVLVVGYNDAMQWAICRNSWGAGWGAAGYFFMPYSVLTNTQMCSDFGVIRTVTKDQLADKVKAAA